MIDLRIGCSGWSYGPWVGKFYTRNAQPSSFLKLYSRVFDSVEIDSTFYRDPTPSMVEGWRKAVPDGFLFTAKVPKEITHERKLKECNSLMDRFTDHISVLKDKLGIVLIQLPPSLPYREGFGRLVTLVSSLPTNLHFAIEFRHESWFREDVYEFLQNSELTTVWTESQMVGYHPVLTSSTAYIRLIGDRSISEEEFGYIRKDRSVEIKKSAEALDSEKDRIRRAYVFANNHFQGFGPATVNLFRQAMGLEPIDWESAMKKEIDSSQKTLF